MQGCSGAKLPKLKLKTWPKQILSYPSLSPLSIFMQHKNMFTKDISEKVDQGVLTEGEGSVPMTS
jgi:hypothetical protein